MFPKSNDAEITLIIKIFTNSIHFQRFEIVCKIASSCARILSLNFPSDDFFDDRKWAGSISWCCCIFSISLDDELHLQVLVVLRDTDFRWSYCDVGKYIDRYGSSSLFVLSLKKRFSMKVWFLVNSSSLIKRLRNRRFAIVIVISEGI